MPRIFRNRQELEGFISLREINPEAADASLGAVVTREMRARAAFREASARSDKALVTIERYRAQGWVIKPDWPPTVWKPLGENKHRDISYDGGLWPEDLKQAIDEYIDAVREMNFAAAAQYGM